MAISKGDLLMGLGAAVGGRAPQFVEGLQQREQLTTERKREELQGRQKAMYQDAYSAFQMLSNGDLDGIIRLGTDRLDVLKTFPDADPSDTVRIVQNATNAKAGDPIALRNLALELTGAAERGVAMGIIQPPKVEEFTLKPGEARFRGGQQIASVAKEVEPGFEIMQAAEVATIPGLDPTKPYQRNMRTRQISQVGGGGTNVDVDMGGPSDKLNELVDTQLAGYLTAASTSASAAPQLELLSQLAPLTTEGQIPAALSRMFPTFNDANQAFIGTTNQVLPSLRVPGSGAQSDKDIDVLLNSIGPLAASADTKQLLIQSMMQKNAINQKLADVTQQVVDGSISRSQAMAAIRQINSQSIISPALQQAIRRIIPMGAQSNIPQSAVDAGVTPDEWNLMTPEQKGAF